MNVIYPILLAIVVILVLTGIVVLLVWKKRKVEPSAEPDYRVFFILGICWLPLSVVFISAEIAIGYVFLVLGLAYLAIGLANHDKWKKK